MQIYAISGATGAGKSYLARKLVAQPNIWHLSGGQRPTDYDHLHRMLTSGPVGTGRVAFDDITQLEQVEALREKFPGQVAHLHIAKREWVDMDEAELRLAFAADYCVSWEPK